MKNVARVLVLLGSLLALAAPALAQDGPQVKDLRPAYADRIATCMQVQGYDWQEVRHEQFVTRVRGEMQECIKTMPGSAAQGAHCVAYGADVFEIYQSRVRQCAIGLLDEMIPPPEEEKKMVGAPKR